MACQEDDHEGMLQSRWKRWDAFHTTLSSASLESVKPEELRCLIKETFPVQLLNLLSPTERDPQMSSRRCGAEWVKTSMRCQESTSLVSVCLHCHQLLGLSAITVLAALMKAEDKKTSVVDVLANLLLEPENVRSLVSLMQHPCRFLRYQARRALVAILALHSSVALEAVLEVAKQCISVILSPTCTSQQAVEPLQLLCSLASKRTAGHAVNLQCQHALKPHLSHMYSICCMKSAHRASGDCSSVLTSTEDVCDSNKADASAEHVKNCNKADCLYLFLCLVQKLAKLINSLDTPQSSSEMQFLFVSVLRRLCEDLFSAFRKDGETEPDWLITRRTLDVIDTVLNCDLSLTLSQLRVLSDTRFPTGNRVSEAPAVVTGLKSDEDDIMTKLAYQVICGVNSAKNCFGRCPSQQIFVGGQYHTTEPDCMEKDSRIVMPGDDSCCNAVLVLLLAVTLKSCAISMRASSMDGERGKEMTAISMSVILSMHSQVSCKLRAKHTSASAGMDSCAERLDWLPQVFGDQDDRWLEALLRLVDIYIKAKLLPDKDDKQTQKLLSLLDPHNLFIELLTLTHFDSSLILDWLTSPETCCLQYFTRYLRLLTSDFSALIVAAQCWDQSLEDCEHSVDVDTVESSVQYYAHVHCQSLSENAHIAGSFSQPTTAGSACVGRLRERTCGGTDEHGNIVEKMDEHISFLISQNNSDIKEFTDKRKQVEEQSEYSNVFSEKVAASSGLALLSGYSSSGESSDHSEDEKGVQQHSDDKEKKRALGFTSSAAADTVKGSRGLNESKSDTACYQVGEDTASHSATGDTGAVCDSYESCDHSSDFNPLMLTLPSAQLRGGQSKHKRVNSSGPRDGISDSPSINQFSPIAPSSLSSGRHTGTNLVNPLIDQKTFLLHDFSRNHMTRNTSGSRNVHDTGDNCGIGCDDDDEDEKDDDDRNVQNSNDIDLCDDDDDDGDDDLMQTVATSEELLFTHSRHPPQNTVSQRFQPQHRGEVTDAGSATWCLDRVMCLLQEVRQKLERLHSRGLMAYNPQPVVALVYRCEELYKASV